MKIEVDLRCFRVRAAHLSEYGIRWHDQHGWWRAELDVTGLEEGYHGASEQDAKEAALAIVRELRDACNELLKQEEQK
jgi:hypothetical protein